MSIDNFSIAGILVVAAFVSMLLAMLPRWSYDPKCESSPDDCD